MMYSKKELAEICGVSVQAIDKKLRKGGHMAECEKVANRLLIPATVATIIATTYRVELQPNQQPTATEVAETATLATTLQLLEKELEIKNRQIADLSAALVAAQDTARAAQALHAADRQGDLMLESAELKESRWARLKKAWRA